MKRFLEIFKIPLIILAVFLAVGIPCKMIADGRPEVTYKRTNDQAATAKRVFDYADKLTSQQEKELETKIKNAENICGTDIIIVTLDESLEAYAKSYESILGYLEPYEYTMVFADNFYDENRFGYDAPYGDGLILVDNWYREADGGVYSWMSTSGKAYANLSTDDVEYILDMCLAYVEDDPAYAYGYFVELVEEHLNPNHNFGKEAGGGISVLIGLVAGLIFFLANLGKKKGKKTVTTKTYVRSGRASVSEQKDIFLTKTIHRRKIETQSSSGGGGHVSAGGHTHGGGGHRR